MSQAKPRAKSWTEIMSLDAMMLGYNHSQETEIKTPGKMRKNGNYTGSFYQEGLRTCERCVVAVQLSDHGVWWTANYFHARLSFRGNGLEKFR